MRDVGIQPSSATYHTVIKACIEACDVHAAEHLLHHMVAAGIQPDTAIYNTVIKAFSEASPPSLKNALNAEAILYGMLQENSGVQADAISYTAVIKAFDSLNAVDSKQHWMREMLKS